MKKSLLVSGIALAAIISTTLAITWPAPPSAEPAGGKIGSLVKADNNYIGINTATPKATLDINGAMKLGSSTTCNEGAIRYNSTSQKVEFCDSVSWIEIGSTFTCGTQIQDIDGNIYDTVEIGTQCWMASNLNVGTKLASASTIPSNNGIIEKWCYNNSDTNCTNEGGLYHWDEAMGYTTTEGAQGICPNGWHIPTDAEQHTLDAYLATGSCNASRFGAWDCDPAGTALKSGGSSGFEGLMAGFRSREGTFINQNNGGYFWSSVLDDVYPWIRILFPGNSTVHRTTDYKNVGLSVRCLKD